MEARWAHNPKVVGSNPTPATKVIPEAEMLPFFIFPYDVIVKQGSRFA